MDRYKVITSMDDAKFQAALNKAYVEGYRISHFSASERYVAIMEAYEQSWDPEDWSRKAFATKEAAV